MNVDTATIGRVWEYETQQMKPEQIVALFRHLYTSGMIWDLPTVYLDRAGEMLARGYFDIKGTD